MSKRVVSIFLILPLLFVTLPLFAAASSQAMVVTSDERATQAALEVLEKGGNAVDALVTAQAALNVVEPQASGLGGAGFLLFYDAGTRSVLFFDGSAKAPAKAYPGMFLQPDGAPLPYEKRRTSGLAVGVPGALKLLWEVHARYKSGRFSFSQLLEPAIGFAENGMTVSDSLAKALEANAEALASSGYFRSIFLKGGDLLKKDTVVVQPDLAKTFRAIQQKGVGAFYSEDILGAIVKGIRESPGRPALMTAQDFKEYGIVKRDPLHGEYEGHDLFSAGPPSAGGLTLFAACNIISRFNPASFAGKPEGIHFVNETIKLSSRIPAMVGDPDVFDLPVREFLSPEWAQRQADKIQFEKTYRMPPLPGGPEEEGKGRASASILIADKAGNIVAYTGTLGDPFGSAFLVPDYGFFLNDLLTDFDTDPVLLKDPDAPNLPGPGQRPRNFITPVFVFKEGKPVLALNSQDGAETAAIVFNMLVQRLDFKVPCESVTAVPRILDRNGVMQMEKRLYDQELLRVRLELWGHKIQAQESLGSGQVVCFGNSSGKITGQADPRGQGEAEGF